MAQKRLFAFLLLLAFCVEPLAVIAETLDEAPAEAPAETAAEAAPVEETAYDPSLAGEILATSTAAVSAEELAPAEAAVEDISLPDESAYAADEVVVKYEGEDKAIVIGTGGETVAETISDLIADPAVEYAEPNYIRGFDAIATDDTDRALLWGLENTGQSVNGTAGIADADTDAPEAWTLSTGQDVTIAVIDSGVDYLHEDLAQNMWDGANCVDESGQPLGGCMHGYDFKDNDTVPLPPAGTSVEARHGTHVAGTIAAAMNNAKGVIGVAPSAKIMAIRFSLDTASEVKAIDFARENGARIINASFSGAGISAVEQEAIQRFTDAGGIFIASAGNGADDGIGDDLDNLPVPETPNQQSSYPASYPDAGIVSVAATTQSDALAAFSNYGAVSADLGAPGTNIRSTFPGNAYGYFSGTSMAAPHVAGAAALLAAYRPDYDAGDIKAVLLDSGDALPGLSGKTVSGKRLNAYAALLASTPPPDTTAPVITLLGANPLALSVGAAFSDPGATAQDDVDGDLTSAIIASGAVDTAAAGTYARTYVVSDAAGNTATSTRDVVVSAVSSGGGGGGGGSSKSRRGGGGGGSSSAAPVLARPLQGSMVLGASGYFFTRDLGLGSMGADVTELQKKLASLGLFAAAPTGYFGPVTASALRAYQSARGLPATGMLDGATRASLNSAPAVPASNAARIAELTALLNSLLAQLKALQGR